MDKESLLWQNLYGKQEDYTAFIETVLESRFLSALYLQKETETKIKEYEKLNMGAVALLRNEGGHGTMTTATGNETVCMVDLGHGVAYWRTLVDDPNTILVDVSMVRPSSFLCLFTVVSSCVTCV